MMYIIYTEEPLSVLFPNSHIVIRAVVHEGILEHQQHVPLKLYVSSYHLNYREKIIKTGIIG